MQLDTGELDYGIFFGPAGSNKNVFESIADL